MEIVPVVPFVIFSVAVWAFFGMWYVFGYVFFKGL